MANPISKPVRFKQVNAKTLINQLVGREPAYPVYRMGSATKYERPGVPGRPYRWI